MKTNLDRWIKKQEASCRRTTKGRWRLLSDAQGPCMVMHPAKGGVAIATLTLTHLPANGVHEPGARKPSPCPEAPGGTTYLPERVANARFIADAHDNMPVALRLIRAALAAGAGAAMQAALDGMLEEQALSGGLRAAPPAAGCRQYEGPRRARRSRTTMTPPLPPTTPTTRCSGARTGNRPKSKSLSQLARKFFLAGISSCTWVNR